jgi:hypothetical protein
MLEAAVSDAGTLLVWAEKYRHPDPTVVASLRHRLLAAGDAARRLARTGDLDGPDGLAITSEVHQVAAGLRALVTAARASSSYRRAVAACAAGDMAALARSLPGIFADVEPGSRPPAAFWVPVWQRRGRALPPGELAQALLKLESDGVPGETDDLTPGVDPELPGLVLSLSDVGGAPALLRYDAAVLPEPSLRLGTDQVLVPGALVRLPFTVALTDPEDAVDEWVSDPAAYRAALDAACTGAGLSLWRQRTPAASS